MTNDPVLIAYGAQRRQNGKRSWWTRIGHAYPHETGAGLTVVLDLMPLDGRIILLEPDQHDDKRLLQEARALSKDASLKRRGR
jgi:hypothetical protein